MTETIPYRRFVVRCGKNELILPTRFIFERQFAWALTYLPGRAKLVVIKHLEREPEDGGGWKYVDIYKVNASCTEILEQRTFTNPGAITTVNGDWRKAWTESYDLIPDVPEKLADSTLQKINGRYYRLVPLKENQSFDRLLEGKSLQTTVSQEGGGRGQIVTLTPTEQIENDDEGKRLEFLGAIPWKF